MKKFIFCIKEFLIMFAMVSMVMTAVAVGTAILLSDM